jgi:hypothetical protein
LRRQLAGFFDTANGGPGSPAPNAGGGRIVGLVAPHIDIQAGGPTFAHAYKAACEGLSPETWVILGTGHEMVENYFAVTGKDFETPLGVVPSDHAFCRELIDRAPRDLLAGEYGHRKEHTIEFQAVFMAAFQPQSRIVPILCSFSLEDWESDREYIDDIAMLLREVALNSQSPVGFIASVDLAHIGPRYGDRFEPDGGTIIEHMAADRLLLESLERADALGFMQTINREGNRRNICGVAPLYMLAKILQDRASGRVLHHAHAVVDGHNSFVTFASMVFVEGS